MKLDAGKVLNVASVLLKAGTSPAGFIQAILKVALISGVSIEKAVSTLKANQVSEEIWKEVVDDHRTFKDFRQQ